MFFNHGNPITRHFRESKLRRIAKEVRAGNTPKGVDFNTICEALKMTAPKNAAECFGILQAKHYDPNGNLKKDLGVVSVKSITMEFAKLLADHLAAYAASTIDDFFAHGQGDDNTAEGTGDVALISQRGERVFGSQTHGATSDIYKSVGTIVASASYTVCEHGIFDTTGAASDRLLDRSVVDSFEVATNDEIEWTYNLTITTGG